MEVKGMDRYNVTGMTCAACSARVEKAVSSVDGVEACTVSLLTGSMSVKGTASETEILNAVRKAGYGAFKKGKAADSDPLPDLETPVLKKRLLISAAFLFVLMYLSMGRMTFGLPAPRVFENPVFSGVVQMLLAIAVMTVNRRFFTKGFSALFKGSPNMDTLVAVGSGAAFGYSLAGLLIMITAMGEGDTAKVASYGMDLYFESAAMIPTLITVGKLLEAVSKGRTTDALKGLMRLAPETAVLYVDGRETETPAENVSVGDIFVVKPGGSIPVDGRVVFGSAAVDEAPLTGESVPVEKTVGSEVYAATVNRFGYLRCQATRVGEDTTLSAVIRTVADAAATKAPIGRIADKVSGIFVPAIMLIAAATFAGWSVAGQSIGFSLARAISVLVISCPCALGLATPVAIMVGSGVGAENGILFKTAASLESLGKTKVMALDKTGTVTVGEPVVTDVIPSGITEAELISLAAAIEQQSEHPLARAIVAKAGDIALPEVTGFEALAGSGVRGRINGAAVECGSAAFILERIKPDIEIRQTVESLASSGKTPLLFSVDGTLAGIIAVSDAIREDSPEAVAALKKMGVRVVMITGDNEKTARAAGIAAGVDEIFAGVLPDGKARVVEKLKSSGKVAMVGDGINDAPALTAADTGVAIGAGADIAVDSADVVLVRSRVSDIVAAVKLSRATLRNIRQNLFWAFFYNAVCIPLATGAFGLEMKPTYGAAAMALSSVCVCMNALRLNRIKLGEKTVKPVDRKEEKEKTTMEKTIFVEGMMCEHCEARVKSALEALEGVLSAAPDRDAKKVTVELTRDTPAIDLAAAIESAGYKVTGVE